MSLFVDAVSSARHLARYQRLRAAQRREDGRWRTVAVRALLRYGVPALAPLLALIGLLSGKAAPQYGLSVALATTLLVVYVGARPRLDAFDLLRHRSRRGLVLGSALYELPWLVWCGACSALAIGVAAAGAHSVVAGRLALLAVFFAPSAFALRGAARRVLDHAGRGASPWYLSIVLVLVAMFVTTEWLPEVSPYLLPALALLIGVACMPGGTLAAIRELTLVGIGLVIVALPVLPTWLAALAIGDSVSGAVSAVALVAVLALGGVELWLAVRHVDALEIVRTRREDDGDGRVAGWDAAIPLRRTRAGTGLPAARRNYLRDEWLPELPPGARWPDHVRRSITFLSTAAFVILRGPALAVWAVLGSGGESGGVLVGAALLAAFWASRIGSVDGTELDERAWLLGVDYRDQVLHGLSCLFFVGALPTMAAALVAWLATSPEDVNRHAAVLLIASAFVLRAGLVGLWPFRETQRMRIGLLLTALAVAAFTYEPVWTGELVARSIYVVAWGGALGLVARLLRLREPRLRECVREG